MKKGTAQTMIVLMFIGVMVAMTSGCVARVQASVSVVGPPQPVVVQSAPPRPPVNAVVVAPVARPGYVFVRGHHQWNGRQWVWIAHRYVPARAGYTWVQPRFDPVGRVWMNGHWVRAGVVVRPAPVRHPAPRRVVVRPAPRRRPAPPPPPRPR